MAIEIRAMTDKDYQEIGRRYGSDPMGMEADALVTRWTRDAPALAPFGYGESKLRDFVALVSGHKEFRAARPDVFAAKGKSSSARDTAYANAWGWVDMVSSALRDLAQTDPDLARRLAAAMPSDDAQLSGRIGALSGLATEFQARLPPDADIAARLAEVAAIELALANAPGNLRDTRANAKGDTAELDVLDGKLYVTIRNVNDAARKAIRNGKLKAQLDEYRFHYVNRSGRPGGPASAPGATPTTPPELDLQH